MKKHTNLDNEIELHKPRTDWVTTLVAAVLVIGLAFCAYATAMVIEALIVISL